MDITPLIPKGKQIIESYGEGGFKISGTHYPQPVLLMPDTVLPIAIQSVEQLTVEMCAPLIAAQTELLLVGGGNSLVPVPETLRKSLRELGIACEPMDTGAACRTYNILLAEERKVAALLLQLT